MSDDKQYLGNGVCVEMFDDQVMLSTEEWVGQEFRSTNIIYLNKKVLVKFQEWLKNEM